LSKHLIWSFFVCCKVWNQMFGVQCIYYEYSVFIYSAYTTQWTSDFITCNIQRKTKSDVWRQRINFIISYCTVYCSYCNLLYCNHNLLQYRFQSYVKTLLLKLKQMLHTLYCRSLPYNGLLSQAETSRRTNQQINNTVQQVGTDSLWTNRHNSNTLYRS